MSLVPVVVTLKPLAPLKSRVPRRLISPVEAEATKDIALIFLVVASMPEGAPVIVISPRRKVWPISPPKVTGLAAVSERVRFLGVTRLLLLMVLPKLMAPFPAVALKLLTKVTGPVKLIPLAKTRMMISAPVPTMMAEPLFEVTTNVLPAKISPAKVSVPPCSRAIFPLVRSAEFNAPTFNAPCAVFKLIPFEVVLTTPTEILLVPAVSNLRLLE